MAEYAAGFRKGAHVRVEGELRSREYETDAGVKVRTYVIVASSIMNLRSGQRVATSQRDPDQAEASPDEVVSYPYKGGVEPPLFPISRFGVNAPPLTDPTNGLVFPDLNSPPFGGETFQTNLIMPEPCPFLSRSLPPCSIIRPTKAKNVAMNVVKFLRAMGLFIGQVPAFFEMLKDLAAEADAAKREG